MNPIESPQRGKNTEKKHSRLTLKEWEEVVLVLTNYNNIADEYGLADALKLSDNKDKNLIGYFFAQRMLRTRIYNNSRILSSPTTLVVVNLPIVGGVMRWLDRIDRKDRLILEGIEKITNIYCAKHYATERDQQHARTIELAVNELVAQATVSDATKGTRINITGDLITSWGEKWIPKLH